MSGGRGHKPGRMHVQGAAVLLEMGDEAVRQLDRRGYHLDLAALRKVNKSRVDAVKNVEALRTEAKRVANEVRSAALSNAERNARIEEGRGLKSKIQQDEAILVAAETALEEFVLGIPNIPLATIPDGPSADFARLLRTVGEPRNPSGVVEDHVEIGRRLRLLDFERATKLSGPRFRISRGLGARLERSLINFLLDLHTREHGYLEWSVPTIVNRAALTGTGQLPKFEEDLFRISGADNDMYLIPTGEVPLTNLHANEVLLGNDLPLAYVAHTPCFRAEAGSYGRDTRGLTRLHEFSKVELVRVCEPSQSETELDKLVSHAERALRELELAFRVVDLPAGDLGFSAERTVDLEVWMPSQEIYREVSSCSRFGDFQSRRARLAFKDANGDRRPPHTLNGSALPIGRTMAALLEQGQRADGSVSIPQALVPYFGFSVIKEDGRGGQ